MSKSIQKLAAISLRRKGQSVRSIAHKIGVSKGTVSVWCRDIELSVVQKLNLKRALLKKNLKGRLLGAEMNKRKRLDVIEQERVAGKNAINALSKRDLLVLATGLFWAEGSKTGSRFVFINSDPCMIRLMKEFLITILHVDSASIHATIQINMVHRPRIGQIQRYWSEILKIPPSQFGRPYFVKIKPKKTYDNHSSYYGIIRLKVLRGSRIQYKMLGLIDALKSASLPV